MESPVVAIVVAEMSLSKTIHRMITAPYRFVMSHSFSIDLPDVVVESGGHDELVVVVLVLSKTHFHTEESIIGLFRSIEFEN